MRDRAGFSRKKFFTQKIGIFLGFLNILKNVVINFYRICSIMKIYIICCVPAQIPYLGKLLFLRHWPKCSQTIRFQDSLINHISRTNQLNSLIFYMVTKNSLKSWSKPFGVGTVRDGWDQPGHRTLKLTVSQELVDGMNWFFACWWKFRKVKSNFNYFWVNVVKIGRGHVVHEDLKCAEWVHELSWFFVCWLWCNNFW